MCREMYLSYSLPLTLSQLSPDILEIVKPLFALHPLSRANGPFRKAATRLCRMRQQNAVVLRLDPNLVIAHNILFAHRVDRQALSRAQLQDVVDRHCRTRRLIFLVDVVALGELSGVAQ